MVEQASRLLYQIYQPRLTGEVLRLKKIGIKCSYRTGASFIAALMVLLMLFFVGTGLLFYTTGGFARVQSERRGATALYLAEAGIDYGCWWLREYPERWQGRGAGVSVLGPPESDWEARDIPLRKGTFRGTFDVQIIVREALGGNPTRFEIISSGYLPDHDHCRPSDKRTLRALVSLRLPGIFDFALASKEDLEMTGSVLVDSWPRHHVGNVGSNDWILLRGGENLIVDGSASGFNGIDSGNATITGRKITGNLLEFPPIDRDAKYYRAREDGRRNGWGGGTGIVTGSLKFTGSDKPPPPDGIELIPPEKPGGKYGLRLAGVIEGDVSITGGFIVLNGILWVNGDFDLAGNARIEGQGTIITTGTMKLTGTCSDVAEKPEDYLAFVSLSDADPAIFIGGTFEGMGKFYAPEGGIKIVGAAGRPQKIFGSLAGRHVEAHGNPHITYDTRRMKDEFMDEIPRPESWQRIQAHLR